MAVAPSASYSFTVRLAILNRTGMLGRVTMVIGKAGGDIGAVDLVEMTRERVFRDITIKARDDEHAQRIIDKLRRLGGVTIANISDRTFLMHLGGKIEVRSKAPIRTRDDLSMAYTPGVARVCVAIKEDLQRVYVLRRVLNPLSPVEAMELLLDKMAKQGWITMRESRAGNRPPRRVYRLTAKGEAQYQKLLRENLGSFIAAKFPGDVGLAYADDLDPQEVLPLLTARRAALVAQLEETRRVPPHAGSLQLLVDHQLRHLEAELDWLDAVIAKFKKQTR